MLHGMIMTLDLPPGSWRVVTPHTLYLFGNHSESFSPAFVMPSNVFEANVEHLIDHQFFETSNDA